jgi:hypothetical protein
VCPLFVQLQFVTPCAWLQLWLLNAQLAHSPDSITPQQVHSCSCCRAPQLLIVCPVSHLEHLQPVRVGVVHTFRQQDTLHGVAALYATSCARCRAKH